MDAVVSLRTLEELRGHVHQTLCSRDHLDPKQTALRETLITRAGRPCGLLFRAQGPRLLATYAVWAGDEGRILFYDCKGTRFGETRLSEGPDPLALAA